MRFTTATLIVLETLKRLLLSQREVYGLLVAQESRLEGGTVYPILNRLEEEGWLSSRWEDPPQDRPPRKYYQWTPKGQREADAALAKRGR